MPGGNELERLQEAVKAESPPDLTPFVGAGLSLAVTKDMPLASWVGLLRAGVSECVRIVSPLPQGWADRMNDELEHGDVYTYVSVADQIARRLGDIRGGKGFDSWIQGAIGNLQPTQEGNKILDLVRRLAKDKLILTTNYDTLIEGPENSGWKPCTWTDGNYKSALLLKKTVVHLHGVWTSPGSIILSSADYERIKGEKLAQLLNESFFSALRFIFIGCGSGLNDPHIKLLMAFLDKFMPRDHPEQFVLVTGAELRQFREGRISRLISPVAYGERFEDLGSFLEQLVDHAEIRVSQNPADYERPITAHGTAVLDVAGSGEEELRRANEALERAMHAIGQVEHRSAMPTGMGHWNYEDQKAVHEQLAASVASPAQYLDSCLAQLRLVFDDMGKVVSELRAPMYDEYSADLAPLNLAVSNLAQQTELLRRRVQDARDDLTERTRRYTTSYRSSREALRTAYGYIDHAVDLLTRDLDRSGEIQLAGTAQPAVSASAAPYVAGRGQGAEAESVQVRVRGKVAAGEPILTEVGDDEFLAIPARYSHHGDAYALKVQGGSMTGAGILNGDYVIVVPASEASNGDMVVVSFPNDDVELTNATVKWWNRHADGAITLDSTVPGVNPMRLEANAQPNIEGRVVAVERWSISRRGAT